MLHAGSGKRGAPKERCPELSIELLYVEGMHSRLGGDANGRALLSEMREWWTKEGITDPGVQDAFETLWRAMEAEISRVTCEQIKERQGNSQA